MELTANEMIYFWNSQIFRKIIQFRKICHEFVAKEFAAQVLTTIYERLVTFDTVGSKSPELHFFSRTQFHDSIFPK